MVMQDLRALAIWGRGDEKELKKKKKNLKSRATQLYPTYMSKSIH